MRRRWAQVAVALDRHPRPVVAVAAAAAALLTVLVTRHGMLLDGDTGSYLRGAQLLAQGRAGPFSLPVDDEIVNAGRFPPGYAWVLALAGGDLTGARVVNALLAATTLGTITALVARRTRGSVAAVTALVLLATRGFVGRMFGFVVAEPLGLAGVWLAVLLADAAATAPDRRRAGLLATGAGLAVAVGAAARNPVVAVVPALAAALLLRCRGRRRMLAVPVALLGPALWLAWFASTRSPGAAGAHHWGFNWFAWYDPGTAADTLAGTWLPGPIALSAPGALAGATLGLAIVATAPWLVVAARRAKAGVVAAGPVVTVLLVLWAQLVAVVGARLWLDPYISFEARHLLTVIVPFVVALALGTAEGSGLPRRLRASLGPLAVAAVVSGALVGVSSFADPVEHWANINEQVDDSALVAVAGGLPESTPLFSNRGDLVLLGTGRVAEGLPVALSAAAVDELLDELEPGATVLLFTDDPLWAPDAEELVARTGLAVRDEVADGLVLVCGSGCRAR